MNARSLTYLIAVALLGPTLARPHDKESIPDRAEVLVAARLICQAGSVSPSRDCAAANEAQEFLSLTYGIQQIGVAGGINGEIKDQPQSLVPSICVPPGSKVTRSSCDELFRPFTSEHGCISATNGGFYEADGFTGIKVMSATCELPVQALRRLLSDFYDALAAAHR